MGQTNHHSNYTDKEYKDRFLKYALKVESDHWMLVHDVTKGSGHQRFVELVKQMIDDRVFWRNDIEVEFKNDKFIEFRVYKIHFKNGNNQPMEQGLQQP